LKLVRWNHPQQGRVRVFTDLASRPALIAARRSLNGNPRVEPGRDGAEADGVGQPVAANAAQPRGRSIADMLSVRRAGLLARDRDRKNILMSDPARSMIASSGCTARVSGWS
jgi:hypothetical protein